ncbi:MAG: FKBP-type peptidyl-prolyl cis-trans isomerase [Wolbachia endosymbiont of Fragariocoptes setiger]|nr:FKBP-type peptidyl-prolyl cis-trans isomerase [Wolbachia endosymbiont of Fragariocoptes setiger]
MIRKSILQLLVSIIIIAILAAASSVIIIYINKNTPIKADQMNVENEGLAQTIAYYLIRPLLESSLEHYIKTHKLNEYLIQKEENITFHDITKGKGNKAYCGQEVMLQLSKFPYQQISQVTFRIGNDEFKEIGLGVIGMQEEGERVVLTNNGKDITSHYVKLIKIIDEHSILENNFMIFDNIKNRTEKKAKCGDNVSVKYTVRNHNGKIQAEDQVLKFKIGENKVPHAIEFGTIGMTAENNRTLIAFPNSLIITDEMSVKNIEFDKENISIIDLVMSD